ncbi:MAG: serine hydrolase [Vicinamibacterales bacterium]|nr:serine hydrolase [Vicinamibacterales bacterium]
MKRLRRSLPVVVACLVLTVALAGQAPPAASSAPPDIDAWVARAMKTFDVPGIGLGIVKDGTVVLAKGYGVRKLGSPEPVDGETLFGIASNTKVFTAVALGLLVEAGKVEWDAPVVRYLPAFQLWDPYVTRELSVRDLLVHRSGLGLGAGDLLWWPPSTYNRAEIAHRLRFIKPATSFRSAYAYDNVLYLVAGQLIEAVSGQSWEDFVTARILKKAGMTGSNVLHSAAAAGGNVAAPHARVDGTVRPIAPFVSDNTNPAGGINSSAEDMARWMHVLLAGGVLPDGSRLFSERTLRQVTSIVTPLSPTTNPPPELAPLRNNFAGYALGLNVRDYYVSRVMMLPDAKLGVAVLTNQESGEAFDSIAYHVVDHYLGAPATDWIEGFRAASARNEAQMAEAEKKAASARDAASTLERYAAAYEDAWYGDIAITLEQGRLVMRFSRTPSLVGDLEHWQYDTFVVRWRDRELRADAFVTFALNPDGSIDQAKMRAVSASTDFSFDFQDLLLIPKRPRV